MKNIDNFIFSTQATRAVMCWCESTEVYIEESDIHSSLKKFENSLKKNSPFISPSMIYAYAAFKMR